MGCCKGAYSGLLRSAVAVIVIARTALCFSYATSWPSVSISLHLTRTSTIRTFSTIHVASSSTTAIITPSGRSSISVQTILNMDFTPSSSSIIVSPTSVLQQASLSTRSTFPPLLSTGSPGSSNQIAPTRTSTRRVEATSSAVILVNI